jgi:2-dehydro-3-deoxygluconokinase
MTNLPALDLVCLGEPLLEFNQTDPRERRFLMGHGGDTSNCAVAAARLGAKVGYLTRLGTDAFGDRFMELWDAERVDRSAVERDPDAPTGIYFVSHGADGHEFTYYRAGSAASLMHPDRLPRAYLESTKVLHASGISQAISGPACDCVFEAMRIVREAGRKVSYDTNLRRLLWPLPRARAVIHEAVRQADILLPGLDDVQALTGLDDPDAIADHYLALGPSTIALTLGSKGALIATPERREHLPAHEVDTVDATGAGDAFDGAFLAEYLRTGDAFRAGRFANAAAALATTGFGAVEPLPRRQAIERLLEAGNRGS